MILRVPDYYETFRCIAGECKDSCCIGWEIDIDEDNLYVLFESAGEKYLEGTDGKGQSLSPIDKLLIIPLKDS